MRLFELAYVSSIYALASEFDSSLKKFRESTQPRLDVQKPEHRQSLFIWLKDWLPQSSSRPPHRRHASDKGLGRQCEFPGDA